MVEVSRIRFTPAVSCAVRVDVAQVSQLPVPAKDRAADTTAPFTATSAGRFTVVPLE